jgi:Zn-dependent protease
MSNVWEAMFPTQTLVGMQSGGTGNIATDANYVTASDGLRAVRFFSISPWHTKKRNREIGKWTQNLAPEGAGWVKEEKTERKKGKFASRWGWFGVLLAGIGSKLKALLPLLKLGKFGGTIITMLLSIGGYALMFPIHFAVGLVLLIFVHEMGHVWAARIKGIPVSAPSFIPFLGAVITMKRQPSDAATEAFIALGGPLLGTVGALICLGVAFLFRQEVWLALALTGFFLNLFNLLPIHPLDGGRIVVAISRWLWVVGLVLGLVGVFYLQSFLLLIIYLMFLLELWVAYGSRWRKMKPVTFRAEITVEEGRFHEAGVWIPGENHRRELQFCQYCDLESKAHVTEVIYPGLGTIVRLNGPTGLVHSIHLVKTFRHVPWEPYLRMILEGTYTPERVGGIQKDERYYQVPAGTRWAFGLLYFGLAAFLAVMVIWLTPKF